MNTFSIRQPIMLYATIFTFLTGIVVALVASVSLVNASRRAYRHAALTQLKDIRAAGNARELIKNGDREIMFLNLAIISPGHSARGIDFDSARAEARTPSNRHDYVALSITTANNDVEQYLLGRFPATAARAIAFVEISVLLPVALLIALIFAALLGLMIRRVLIPPLSALSAVAQSTQPATLDLVPSDAPFEIYDIEQQFRHTVHQLIEERRIVEEQRDELEQMQGSLIQASKLASVGRLAAGIAHEIGNPLSAVMGYLSLINQGLSPEEQTDALSRSLNELQRIHQTIKKLLTYAREGEGPTEAPIAFHSADIISETLHLMRKHPSLRNVDIQWNPEVQRAGPDASGHTARFAQVLVNLLLNAGHATAEVSTPIIQIERRYHPNHLEIYVSDNGPGINPEEIDSIFDPFYTTKAPGEGTGLGLAVSRSLMIAMGGGLRVHTEVSSGACFRLTLNIPSA